MSLDASGTVAKTLTFAKWKGRNYVRQTVIPANPDTPKQQSFRAVFKFITQIFGTLSTLIQGRWKDVADPLSITALNAMVSDNADSFKSGKGLRKDPTLAPGASEAAPTNGAAVAGIQQLTVTWNDSVGANDWATLIYMDTVNNFTAGPDNCIGEIGRAHV